MRSSCKTKRYTHQWIDEQEQQSLMVALRKNPVFQIIIREFLYDKIKIFDNMKE